MNQVGQIYERPWGTYRTIEQNGNYQLKHIVVYPHKRLSLQKHQHRSEHWTIIKGKGTATIGKDEHELSVNQSAYIPKTVVHRMSNTSDTRLEFLEIQIGEYLGEDDIERLEDDFNRK